MTEAEAVEFLAEEGGIVHGAEFGGGFGGFGFRVVAIEAGRGGHVEAFGAFDEVRVVDFDEMGFVLIREGDAGGAVGLVADDEVKGGEAGFLGVRNGLDGMVGGEDDRHAGGISGFLVLGGEGAV